MSEKLGVAGSGAIACGLAATAASSGDVVLLARSEASAERARATIAKFVSRMEGVEADAVTVTTDVEALRDRTAIVEAIAEEYDAKAPLLKQIAGLSGDDVLLGTTTSSLSVEKLAGLAGVPERFVGFHVFNPVTRMKLVELAFATQTSEAIKDRARALCEALGKTIVETPDTPGFVVNALLFPYLFHGASMLDPLTAQDVDTAMKLGAGHPMGPLELLDFVGLDVSAAIGEAIGADVPKVVYDLIAEGKLGRKSGQGFYDYSK